MPTVRELVTKLETKGNASSKLATFGLAVNGIKAGLELMVGAFKAAKAVLFDFTSEMAKQGDEIAKAARNIGVSAEELQELKFAAELSGAGMKDVQTAIQRMGKGLNDATRTGTGPFADSLAQMGLAVEDFDGLDPVERFQKLAGALSNLEDSSEKAALAQDLFGRGGKTLIPLLDLSEEGIKKVRLEARKLGLQFTNKNAKAAEDFVDAQLRMKTVIKSVKGVIAAELFPVIQNLIDTTREWIEENRELIEQRVVEFIQDVVEWVRKLQPAFDAVVRVIRRAIPVVQEWAEALLEMISEDLEEFIGNLVERFQELLPVLEDGIDQLIEWALIIRDFAIDLAEFVEEIGGLERALKLAVAGFLAFKLAAAAALGPTGKILAAFIVLLPFAIELGDALGEIVFNLTALGRETAKLDRKAGGVNNLRGEAAVIQRNATGRRAAGIRTSILADEEGGSARLAALKRVTSEQGRAFVKTLESDLKRVKAERKAKKEGDALLARLEERDEKDEAREERRAAARKRRAKIKRDLEIAKENAKQEKKRLRERLGFDEKDERLSDSELLVLIQKAGATGQSLTGLIGGRKLATTGPPPVITVTVTNFNIEQNVEAPVTVTGVPGEDAEGLGERIEDTQRRVFSEEIRAAMEEIQPVEAR